jgi:hypothetical protein
LRDLFWGALSGCSTDVSDTAPFTPAVGSFCVVPDDEQPAMMTLRTAVVKNARRRIKAIGFCEEVSV